MKKVAVIHDLSSFGKCSLTAAIPVLSVMGVQACPLPTAILTAQTEYPSYFCEDLTSKMHYFIEEWEKLRISFDGIYTGFVTGRKQIDNIFNFLDKFYTEETQLLVDPVMGDMGAVYNIYTDDLLERMKTLVKSADVITPNVTECCLLSGFSYEKLHSYSNELDFLKALEDVGRTLQYQTGAKVIITGVNPPSENQGEPLIGNMYVDENQSNFSSFPYNGRSYSGTGDLFASVIMGSLMRGDNNVQEAIQLAQDFLTVSINDTYLENIPTVAGVNFEKYLKLLL